MTVLGCLAPAIVAFSSASLGDGLRLIDDELRAPESTVTNPEPIALAVVARPAWLRLAASDTASADEAAADTKSEPKKPSGTSPTPTTQAPSLDFDLLGAPQTTKVVDQEALDRRRTLLTWHQGVGLGMFALQLATTAVGQLNYDDKFGGDNTGKYVQPHAILAFSTLAAFAAAGTLALLAPKPLERDEGFDRVSLHKLSMIVATAGMVAQGVLGVYTQSREGYLNQQSIATTHLVIGYVTLAAVAVGIGALVF